MTFLLRIRLFSTKPALLLLQISQNHKTFPTLPTPKPTPPPQKPPSLPLRGLPASKIRRKQTRKLNRLTHRLSRVSKNAGDSKQLLKFHPATDKEEIFISLPRPRHAMMAVYCRLFPAHESPCHHPSVLEPSWWIFHRFISANASRLVQTHIFAFLRPDLHAARAADQRHRHEKIEKQWKMLNKNQSCGFERNMRVN